MNKWLFFFSERLELRWTAHGDGTRTVRHLLAGRVVIAVGGNRFNAQALHRNQNLFAQLARAEQHDFGCVGGQGGGPRVVIKIKLKNEI